MENFDYISTEAVPLIIDRNDKPNIKLGKRIVYLYLAMKNNSMYNVTRLCYMYSSVTSLMTIDEILDEVIRYIDTISHPSIVSQWIYLISNLGLCDYLENRLTIMNRTHYLFPKGITYKKSILQTVSHEQPPTLMISILNSIDPQLTGFLLENILANIIGIDEPPPSIPGNIDTDLAWNDKNTDVFFAILKNEIGEWKSKYHFLIYASIMDYFKLSFDSDGVSKAAEYMNYFTIVNPSAIRLLRDYENVLSETTYVKSLSRRVIDGIPYHGIRVNGTIESKSYQGEIDFVIGDSIIDAKAVKITKSNEEEKVLTWFSQVNIYRKLYNKNIKHLEVISFLNNTVYTFEGWM